MIELLKEWESRINYVEEVYDNLNKLLLAQPDSPLFNALYQTLDAYTRTLEFALVGNSESGWLSWYWMDNNLGKNEFEANPGTWEQAKPIKSLEDLEELLKESKRRDYGQR